MRTLATIQKILDLQPIPNATAIEVATVLGWHVVVKKGEFKVGDPCIFYEIDSLLPMLPKFAFLAKNGTKKTLVDGKLIEGYRLKTVKLRGQISQGLALPVTLLPISEFDGSIWKEGTDVTAEEHVYKYEPPMSAQLMGKAKGVMPGYIPKTDEMRIQAVPFVLTRNQNKEFYVTEKIDGSSATIFLDKLGQLNVCSRTINWLEDSNNTFWQVTKEYNLAEKIKAHPTIALQGELMGEGIQSNRLKIKGHKIYFYSAFDYTKQEYLGVCELRVILKEYDVPMVPVIDMTFRLPTAIDELVTYATRKSLICPEVWAEGIVIRSIHEDTDEELGRLSFKTINPEYLLKHGE